MLYEKGFSISKTTNPAKKNVPLSLLMISLEAKRYLFIYLFIYSFRQNTPSDGILFV